MSPLVVYFLNLARSAGNTPTGQRFLQLAQQAADQVQRGPKLAGSSSLGANASGPFYSGFAANTASRFDPVSRGVAGLAGVNGVGMGSGRFEGVRDRLYEGAKASPIPQSLWGELDARSVNPPPMPEAPPPQSDINYDRQGLPDDALGGWENPPPPQSRPMPQAALAAVSTARNIVGGGAPTPPPRPQELRTGAPMTLPSSPDYQSNNRPVRDNQGVNWGDPESASDFFRADREGLRNGYAEGGGLGPDPMGGLMPPDMASMPIDAPLPMPADAAPPPSMEAPKAPTGGGAGGKDAAINKALDIIHKLISGQRI